MRFRQGRVEVISCLFPVHVSCWMLSGFYHGSVFIVINIKSGGTKYHFKRIKVPGIAPY